MPTRYESLAAIRDSNLPSIPNSYDDMTTPITKVSVRRATTNGRELFRMMRRVLRKRSTKAEPFLVAATFPASPPEISILPATSTTFLSISKNLSSPAKNATKPNVRRNAYHAE